MVWIIELVFSCCRSGWTAMSLELLKRLIWRHSILTEEIEGFTNCTITLHNLMHLPEDIHRFSSPDNYWCFVFERAVHKCIVQSSNNKNLELMFAKSECRRKNVEVSWLFSIARSWTTRTPGISCHCIHIIYNYICNIHIQLGWLNITT